MYTQTRGHVGEYYGPNFSCAESASYPEKKKRQELNLRISEKIYGFCFLGVTQYKTITIELNKYLDTTTDRILQLVSINKKQKKKNIQSVKKAVDLLKNSTSQ